MRISLLARDDQAASTVLLKKSAHRLGLELRVLNIENLRFENSDGRPRIWSGNDEVLINNGEWIWPRLGSLTREPGLAIFTALTAAGFRAVNSVAATRLASDKVESWLCLQKAGIPVPHGWVFWPWTRWPASDLEGSRFWVKNRVGSQGLGVAWADSAEQALAQADLIRMNQGAGLIQRHVPGREVRALVWRDEVLGAVEKTVLENNPRGNAHQGSRSRVCELSMDARELCLKAARAMDLSLAGVDLILGSDKMDVLEVNPSPGFSHLTEALGIDCATRLLTDLSRL